MYAETINDMSNGIFTMDVGRYNELSAFEKLRTLMDIINWANLEKTVVEETNVVDAGEVRRGTEVVA